MTDQLARSVNRYRAVLEHAAQLEDLLAKGDPKLLTAYSVRLNELQQAAGLEDHQLLTEIARDSARWQSHPLFLQRAQLLEQIMEMNDLLLPRVRGMMAVTAAELKQLKVGRVAVSGYQQQPARDKNSARGVG